MSEDEQRFRERRETANDAVTCLHMLFNEFHLEVEENFKRDYQLCRKK